MSVAIQPLHYPAAMEDKLRKVRRRRCVLAAGRALLLAAAVLLAATLLALVVDGYFTLFNTAVRLGLTTTAVMSGIWTLGVALRPVLKSLRLRLAAGSVDQVVPQLEERWTTVANFVEYNHRPTTAIGKVMFRQVTSEAVAMEQLVVPAKIVTAKQLVHAAAWFLAACVLLTAFFAVNPQHHRVLLQRFLSPLANITATQLESMTGDITIPRGEPLTLAVHMSGVPRKTGVISIARDQTDVETVELRTDDDQARQFNYPIAAVESSFRYRAESGDGSTPWHTVTVIDYPSLAEVTLTLTAPEYVERPVYEKDYLPARLQAVQGSHLLLEMRPKARLQRLDLVTSRQDSEQKIPLVAARTGWYRHEMILEEDVTLTLELLSPHGLTNEEVQECRIRVIADRAPVARLISPTDETAVRPEEVIDLKFEAHDDHGITKAELVVYAESAVAGEPPMILSVEEIPLGDQQDAPHVIATAKLDLSKYNLTDGASISFAVRVTDNRTALMQDRAAAERTARRNAPADRKEESRPRESADDVDRPSQSEVANDSRTSTSEPGGAAAAPDSKAVNPSMPAEEAPVAKAASPEASADKVTAKVTKENSTIDLPVAEKAASPERAGPADGGLADADARLPSSPDEAAKAGSPGQSESAKEAASDPGPLANTSEKMNRSPAAVSSPDASTESTVESTASAKSSAADRDPEKPESGLAVSGPTNSESVPEAGDQPPREVTAKMTTGEKPGDATSDSSVPPAPFAASLARDVDEPRDDQSMVTGDLRTAARRPTMTDDLPGQLTESNRLRLKIEEKVMSASAEPGLDREPLQMKIRQRLEEMDRELQPVEVVLTSLVAALARSGIADPHLQQLNQMDGRLAQVDRLIAGLRKESEETPYAFAGLHMVEIGAAHVTPARDRVFALIRQPDTEAHGNAAQAMHHVSRTRELIAELLIRFDRVLQEESLAEAIDETAKMYEVYVAELHRFLQAQSKPNPDPLQRKMAVVNVSQEYLDRLVEVTEMRRDLMKEFARMIGDDPRLLSKYMDLIQRRQRSLRDRLLELAERQEVLATELSGWLRVDSTQRDDVWMLAAEVRLHDLAPLAQEAAELEERVLSQLPLALDPQEPLQARLIQHARQVAVHARTAAAQARRLLRDPFDDTVNLATDIDAMAHALVELDAGLEELAFLRADEETVDYSNKRLAESRALFERVVQWTETAIHLEAHRFQGLAKVEQQQLAWRTDLLRIDIDNIDQQLEIQFRGTVPAEITTLANELKEVTEAVTFNQAAATFALESDQLDQAEAQQALAVAGFARAEELFEEIRRKVVEVLDQTNPPDPNVAELEDPTLDELLQQLEREQNLAALLGLPNRPQNLRELSDFFASPQGSLKIPSALEQAAAKARQRAEQEEKDARRMRPEQDDDMTDEQWREIQDAEEAQQKLDEKIAELQRQAEDPDTDPEQAAQLRQMAEQLQNLREQLAHRQINNEQWQAMVRSDQMRAVLRAAARGEPLPNQQWNRLMSSLDDGLWQVRRRTPPEEFRRAIEQYHERLRTLIDLEKPDEVF